jgi:hypothetical protein
MLEEAFIVVLLFFGLHCVVKDYTKKNRIWITIALFILFALCLYILYWFKRPREPFIEGGGETCGTSGKICSADKPYCLITEKVLPENTFDQTVVFNTYGRYINIYASGDGTPVTISKISVYGPEKYKTDISDIVYADPDINKEYINLSENKANNLTAPCDGTATDSANQAAKTVDNTKITPRKWPDIWRSNRSDTNTPVWRLNLGSTQMITKIRFVGEANSSNNKGIRFQIENEANEISGVYTDIDVSVPTKGTCIPIPNPLYPTGTTEIEKRAIKMPILYGVNPDVALNVFRGLVNNTTVTSFTSFGLSDEQSAKAFVKLQSNILLEKRNTKSITDTEYFTNLNTIKNITKMSDIQFDTAICVTEYRSINRNDYIVPDGGGGISTTSDNGEYKATQLILSVLIPETVDPTNSAIKGIDLSTSASLDIKSSITSEPRGNSTEWGKGVLSEGPIQPTGINIPEQKPVTVNTNWSDAQIKAAISGRDRITLGKQEISSRGKETSFLKNKKYTTPNRQSMTLSSKVEGATSPKGPLKEVFWLGPTASSGYDTMSNANQACIDVGADGLATKGALDSAQASGAQWCIYGWLIDGTKAFPMVQYDANCGGIGVNTAESCTSGCPSPNIAGALCYGIKPRSDRQSGFTILPFTYAKDENGNISDDSKVWNQKDSYDTNRCKPGLVKKTCRYSNSIKDVCLNPRQTCNDSCQGPLQKTSSGKEICNTGRDQATPGNNNRGLSSLPLVPPNALTGISNLFTVNLLRTNKITSADADLSTVSKSIFLGRILRSASYTLTEDVKQDIYVGSYGMWIIVVRNTQGADLELSRVVALDAFNQGYPLDKMQANVPARLFPRLTESGYLTEISEFGSDQNRLWTYAVTDPLLVTHNVISVDGPKGQIQREWQQNDVNDTNRNPKLCKRELPYATKDPLAFIRKDGIWMARIRDWDLSEPLSPYIGGVRLTFGGTGCFNKNNKGVVVMTADTIDVSDDDYYLIAASVYAKSNITVTFGEWWTSDKYDAAPTNTNSINMLKVASNPNNSIDTVLQACGLSHPTSDATMKNKLDNFCKMTDGKYILSANSGGTFSVIYSMAWENAQKKFAVDTSFTERLASAINSLNTAKQSFEEKQNEVDLIQNNIDLMEGQFATWIDDTFCKSCEIDFTKQPLARICKPNKGCESATTLVNWKTSNVLNRSEADGIEVSPYHSSFTRQLNTDTIETWIRTNVPTYYETAKQIAEGSEKRLALDEAQNEFTHTGNIVKMLKNSSENAGKLSNIQRLDEAQAKVDDLKARIKLLETSISSNSNVSTSDPLYNTIIKFVEDRKTELADAKRFLITEQANLETVKANTL